MEYIISIDENVTRITGKKGSAIGIIRKKLSELIRVGNFIAIQDNKGNWLYKADQNSALKANGTLKAKYKDLPRYDVINEWEDSVKNQYSKSLKIGVDEITKLLAEFSK
jgi:hypothetical protein